MRYEVTRVFDASNGQTIDAETPEGAAEIAMNDDAARPHLCNQCADDVELGDHIRTIVYDQDGNEVYDDGFEALEIKQLRAELCRVTGERDELLVGAQAFCAAINHALSLGMEADAFLLCWNEGDWDGCREFDFPEEAIDLSKGVSP